VSSQGPLPYLEWCGVEVANVARTLSYLRRGLGNTMQGHWILGGGEVCGVLYRLNGGDCLLPDVFVSPTADPAPWYDPDEPGAATFLGVILTDITGYDSPSRVRTTSGSEASAARCSEASGGRRARGRSRRDGVRRRRRRRVRPPLAHRRARRRRRATPAPPAT
jgi:hypothetical protein